jgi:hydrogenase maturation protein HypF
VPVPDPIVRDAWRRRLNAPQSSAAGRVFDAAAALILGVGETSFEGQGPMWLEAVARPCGDAPRLTVEPDDAGLLRVDWAPLVRWLLQHDDVDAATRAGAVHASLAEAIVTVAERVRTASGEDTVGLTGGVFQNRLLVEAACDSLRQRGFRVLLPVQLPAGDGGLSYGQVADFVGRNV